VWWRTGRAVARMYAGDIRERWCRLLCRSRIFASLNPGYRLPLFD
jgi:hypothetical protein